jgi:sulfur carrier protein
MTGARMSWSSHLAICVIDFVGRPYLGRGPPTTMLVSPPMSESIDVVINGETRTVVQGTTVAELVEQLGLGDRRVAVERNREVVPRAQHASTVLGAGDRVEVVTFVGGG